MSDMMFFVKQDPSESDPGAVSREIDRRARYLQVLHKLDYGQALKAVLLADGDLERKYVSSGGSPAIVSWNSDSGESAPGGQPGLSNEGMTLEK